MKLADEDYARVRKLGTGVLSRAEYDSVLAARDRARGRVNAARALMDMYTRGSRVEDIADARAEYERWQAHYLLLKRGTRDEDKAAAYAEVAKCQADLADLSPTTQVLE